MAMGTWFFYTIEEDMNVCNYTIGLETDIQALSEVANSEELDEISWFISKNSGVGTVNVVGNEVIIKYG